LDRLCQGHTGRLWSWAYGDSRKEAREGLVLDGLLEHSEERGRKEVTYELVVDPPRRTAVQAANDKKGAA
jgi:hypothetical protein